VERPWKDLALAHEHWATATLISYAAGIQSFRIDAADCDSTDAVTVPCSEAGFTLRPGRLANLLIRSFLTYPNSQCQQYKQSQQSHGFSAAIVGAP
jgi:hypothetical protein